MDIEKDMKDKKSATFAKNILCIYTLMIKTIKNLNTTITIQKNTEVLYIVYVI